MVTGVPVYDLLTGTGGLQEGGEQALLKREHVWSCEPRKLQVVRQSAQWGADRRQVGTKIE